MYIWSKFNSFNALFNFCQSLLGANLALGLFGPLGRFLGQHFPFILHVFKPLGKNLLSQNCKYILPSGLIDFAQERLNLLPQFTRLHE